MRIIAGYQIDEQIYESATSTVYRGRRAADALPVVLKLLKPAYPPPEKIAWFKREYELTRSLVLPGVIVAHGLVCDQQQWVMVLEDCGGESLTRLQLAGTLSPGDFLTLAIQISEILAGVHQQLVIHKDLNPSNIVLNPQTGQVKLIDFGISTRLARETPTFRNPEVLEGTLAYLSPEQTGRMNRAIDYRSDFYALGATFYELLTGQLPFESDDPIELVHAHIAKTPLPPDQVNPAVPPAVAAIVMKLLAKTAEGRYQSAEGLKADLEACARQLNQIGRIEAFPLGRRDVSDRFQIPEKLYGRADEIARLLAIFDQVAAGHTGVVLCLGEPGVGKSMLINEVHKPIVEQRGYFIAGKYDQFKRDIPYSAVAQAFQDFTRQLLTESAASLGRWKAELLQAVGNNGQVVVDLIPELELVLGPQPAVQPLPATEAQNRFQYVFQNFVRAITQQQRPLVLFLDDLQWADSASLNLLKALTTDVANRCFLVIGAYRDTEVDAAHPLLLVVEEIKQAQVTVNTIKLDHLAFEHVDELIADTLHCAPAYARPLARLVYEKTQGNAFFVNQFLKALYDQRLLTFDFQRRAWQWDTDQIRARDVTDNVVTLMAGKIQKLPATTQQVLVLAACIGNQFDLATLAAIHQHQPVEALDHLWPAIMEGLVLPLDDTYKLIAAAEEALADLQSRFKFLHDRVQQAAYELIPESEQQAIHLKIGRLLWATTPETALGERLFDITNHFNLGLELITDTDERARLAELNLRAGQKAKASTAYQTALRYLTAGMALLPAESWASAYPLTFDLHLERAECEYLVGDFERAAELFELIVARANTALEKAIVFNLLVILNNSRFMLHDSLDAGKKGLALLGVQLPDNADEKKAELGQAFGKVHARLANMEIEDLATLPELTEPDKIKIMELCTNMLPPAFLSGDPDLYALLILSMVSQSLFLGNSSLSSHAYVMYGVILDTGFGDYANAYRFGELGLKLGQKYKNSSIDTKNYFGFANWLNPWKRHLKTSSDYLLRAYTQGLESGDITFACYAVVTYLIAETQRGARLDDVYQEALKYRPFIEKTKDQNSIQSFLFTLQSVLCLKGETQDKYRLDDDGYDEAAQVMVVREAKNWTALCYYWSHKLIIFYLYGNHTEAQKVAQEAMPFIASMAGTFLHPMFLFYHTLTLTALYSSLPEEEKQQTAETFAAHQAQMKTWSEQSPENYRQIYLLVSAEMARIEGRDLEAMALYDQAIQSAHDNEYTHHEAIANELAAKFYLAQGHAKIAAMYLTEAYYVYGLWGATRKVQDLEQHYPQWLSKTAVEREGARKTASTDTSAGAKLDLATVLKASQAISSEINFDRLLARLIQIAIENAGAETGCLILKHEGRLHVEAFGTADSPQVAVRQSIPIEAAHQLSPAIVNYVARTQESVVLGNAAEAGLFTGDLYVQTHRPKSVLCLALLHTGKLTGVLYLENNLVADAFTPERLEVLTLLASQIAISIENARLYTNLQQENAERQRAEAELRAAEEQYRGIFEHAIEGIFQSTPAGAIIAANPALVRMLGYASPSELMTTVTDIRTQLYVQSDQRAEFARLLETNGVVQHFETELYRKDGSVIWVSTNARVVHDSAGQIRYYEGSAEDITERKRAAADREARLAAEAANQAKSAFLATMSHELRTPLNAILGFTHLLARQEALPQKAHEDLGIILRSGEHLLALINDVLEMSKIESGRVTLIPSRFDLYGALDDLEGMFRLRAEHKGLDLVIDRAPDVPQYIETDERKLRQVLINLLGNAIKLTEAGHVTLRVSVVSGPLSAATDNGPLTTDDGQRTIRFAVEDTGVGIAADELDQLFQPFVQTSSGQRVQEGTGLGLPISRRFVQLMGGDISVTSRPRVRESGDQHGSTFAFDIRVQLVHAAPRAAAAPARQVLGLEPGQPDYRLLVADDNPENRTLLRKLLEEVGFSVQEAANGQEAIAVHERWRPQLIWMDMRMPVMDGLEATRRIKASERGPATTIIAVSASSFEEERATTRAAGCDDFLRKPFREADLFALLEKHLDARFVFADAPAAAADQTAAAGATLDAAALAAVPPELLAALEQAVSDLNPDAIQQAIAALAAHDAGLAQTLAALAHDFHYDRIVRALVRTHAAPTQEAPV